MHSTASHHESSRVGGLTFDQRSMLIARLGAHEVDVLAMRGFSELGGETFRLGEDCGQFVRGQHERLHLEATVFTKDLLQVRFQSGCRTIGLQADIAGLNMRLDSAIARLGQHLPHLRHRILTPANIDGTLKGDPRRTHRVEDMAEASKDESKPDRRSARWHDHREARRADLVAAAVAAIDQHGPQASIAEMARAAGVTKPVLYRYFADKDDLYRAVGHWGAHEVLTTLRETLHGDGSIQHKIAKGCADYLRLIESHPQVFLLLVEHRTNGDPLRDGKELIAASFARQLSRILRSLNLDVGGAEPWAHGIVGLGLAQGEWWLRRKTMSRSVAADYLADFIWQAVNGLAQEQGVTLT